MKNIEKFVIATVVVIMGASAFAGAKGTTLNATEIENLTRLKGAFNAKDGVFKVTYSRKDLKVIANGVKITPALGLTAWAAFKNVHGRTMVMGDLVLTEGQVNYVMSAALENGLAVTALHNHFLGESPRIMFMHIGGLGTEEKMASAVGAVFTALKESADYQLPKASIDPANSNLNNEKLDRTMRARGKLSAGVYKFVFGRTTAMHGAKIGKAMGVNTWAAFAGTDKSAVVDGDFVVRESELQNVLKTLRAHNVDIVSIHNHMIEEIPRCIYLHYWGIGKSVDLAAAVRAAIDTETNK